MESPIAQILPESKKFEKTENWTCSKYVSIKDYPYLKFLPKEDKSINPVDSFAKFPGGLDSLSKVFTKNIKLSNSYIASQQKRSTMFRIMIDENGKLKIVEDPNEPSLNLYPDNYTFYNKVLKTLKRLPNWEPAKRDNMNVKNYFMLFVDLDNGKIIIQLLSINDKR